MLMDKGADPNFEIKATGSLVESIKLNDILFPKLIAMNSENL